MGQTENKMIEATAEAMADAGGHYLGAVSAMAGRNEVLAAQDIVSSTGVKLVARGARVDESLQRKLSGHRLAGLTLEESLMVADGVTADSLAADIADLIERDVWLARLAHRSDDPLAMRHGAAGLNLPRELQFRLTIARDQRPVLYRHLLATSVISHYIALRSRQSGQVCDCVRLAALCHDLGELHTDPAILEPGHRITAEERRFIYVHPVTGWLILRKMPGIDPEVARTVLQHHERLDGSGYPHGRRQAEIGTGARILAVADVADAIAARYADERRLSALLRLNYRKYDARFIDALHDALDTTAPAALHFEREDLARKLKVFAAVLDGWTQLREDASVAGGASGAFLAERMFNLRSVVLQFGFDPDSLEMPLQLAEEDPAIAAELTSVFDELGFQLAELGHEFDRRTPAWLGALDGGAAQRLSRWREQLAACLA